jgi:N-acetylglucosamine kinase-like BadF-type ATPase
MMIIIADSGSTKTTWCFISNENEKKFVSTSGINPFFRTTSDIVSELEQILLPELTGKVEKIHFYGAGIVNDEKSDVLKSAFLKLFGEVFMEVNSDLLAAARATLGNHSGIACILGTGSNSCFYDGCKITRHIPPLGFILGDEGSGAMLGKKLLADYLKGIMPAQISERFQIRFPFEYGEFLDRVYKQEKPNRFLAGFVPFIRENISDEYCSTLVEISFREFVRRNIFGYPGFEKQKICFTGSVAWFFREQLENVLRNHQLGIEKIVQEPMDGLIQFHQKY